MTSPLVKDLFMLQWTLNGFLEAGSDEVRRSDIRIWVDPDSSAVFDALRDWESKGYISLLTDPQSCKEKDVCFKILKPIAALPEPEDLNEGS